LEQGLRPALFFVDLSCGSSAVDTGHVKTTPQTVPPTRHDAYASNGSFRMIECELQSHDAYGTPQELFGKFFSVIADTMREILGTDWSPEIDEAWRMLLSELDRLVTQPEV
jgi:hypothetical protein